MMDQPTVEEIPCNLCGAQTTTPLYVKGGLAIAQCQQCQLVYANPRLTKDEIWKRYSPDYFWQEYMPAHHAPNGEYVAAFHQMRNRPMLTLLEPFKGNGRLLEVGCAAGFFLKVAADDGWEVQGLEIMEPAVAYAREILGLDMLSGTLENASLPENSCAAVVLIETVEHLLNPAETLQEVYRILQPGGAIFIAVPNQNSIMHTLHGIDWSVLSPAEHLYYFTEETMNNMLQKIGFCQVSFHWQLPNQPWHELVSPYNTHNPNAWRSHLIRHGIQLSGRFVGPLAAKMKRTDRLMALAIK
ncbi:MAG: class I SAM-dependent methyltransferase [Chloroflexota bacterium]